MAMVPCRFCGTLNRSNAQFCGKCGRALNAPQGVPQSPHPSFVPQSPAPVQPPANPAPIAKPRTYLPLYIGLVVVICLLAAILAALAYQLFIVKPVAMSAIPTPVSDAGVAPTMAVSLATAEATAIIPTSAPATLAVPATAALAPTNTSTASPTATATPAVPTATATRVVVDPNPPIALPFKIILIKVSTPLGV